MHYQNFTYEHFMGERMSREKADKEREGMAKNIKNIFEAITAVATAIVAVMTLVSPFINHFISKDEMKVTFNCNPSTISYAGVDYVQYELSTIPSVQGYQIKPYPFICVFLAEENVYFPLENFFTQRQYSADESGVCSLFREDTVEELKKLFKNVEEDSIEMGTILAVEYILNEEKCNEFFWLGNGELLRMEGKEAEDIIHVFWEEDTVTLDMEIFPCNAEEIEKKIQMKL